jgi:hypothetical protein
MAKVPPTQCPSSAPAPPQGAPGGSGRLGDPSGEPGPLSAQSGPRLLKRATPKATLWSLRRVRMATARSARHCGRSRRSWWRRPGSRCRRGCWRGGRLRQWRRQELECVKLGLETWPMRLEPWAWPRSPLRLSNLSSTPPTNRQREFCASVAAAPKEKPVLVLSLQGKFNINVFTSRRSCTKEPGQKELTASLRSLDSMRPSRWASTSRRSTSKNDYRKSVLTVE